MKQLFGKSVDSNPADGSAVQSAKPARKLMKSVVAMVVITALLLSVSVIALAVNSVVNPNKKATLTLNTESTGAYSCIRKSDTVTLSGHISDFTTLTFRDGVYGLTIDIIYDSAVFSYVEDSARNITDKASFSVLANPNVNGDGDDVVSVLVFANNDVAPLSFIDDTAGLFALDFTVVGNVNDTVDFEPFDWKFADKQDSGNGFELITLYPTPVSEGVTVKQITAGDINGDNAVSVKDLVIMKKHLVQTIELSGGDLLAAKADGNAARTLDGTDIVWLRKTLLGLS